MDTIKMLETLKKDYLGMGYQVEFDKYVLEGIADGLTITEKMNFVSLDYACKCAATVTESLKVPFVILEMRGQEGQVENF